MVVKTRREVEYGPVRCLHGQVDGVHVVQGNERQVSASPALWGSEASWVQSDRDTEHTSLIYHVIEAHA